MAKTEPQASGLQRFYGLFGFSKGYNALLGESLPSNNTTLRLCL